MEEKKEIFDGLEKEIKSEIMKIELKKGNTNDFKSVQSFNGMIKAYEDVIRMIRSHTAPQ